jgi:hypothetical protein
MLISLNARDDYQVAAGTRDPRGWLVTAADGHIVGAVDDLVAETADMRVQYVDVGIGPPEQPAGRIEQHMLVPVTEARLADGRMNVTIGEQADRPTEIRITRTPASFWPYVLMVAALSAVSYFWFQAGRDFARSYEHIAVSAVTEGR